MKRTFAEENTRSRMQLEAFVRLLSESQLSQALPGGWTVASVLAHIAFWDYRALALLRRWETSGTGPSPIDIDAINDATQPLLLALPPYIAAEQAVTAARLIDAELEHAPRELITAIEAMQGKFRLYRSEHRDEHLEELKRLLELPGSR